MKKAFLSVVLITIASCSFAQWTTSGTNIYSSNTGNVGVGTTNPQALLDVGKEISGGALGTVLARQSEGDGTGGGTSLNARAWETQFTNFNGKSFSLEHSFYGMVNSSINFYRGGSQTGGYMAFATNNGKEQMVITALGSVGIGTISPAFKLDVQGGNASIYNNGGLSSVLIGSAATGKTSVSFGTSSDASGYGIIQVISAYGASYGNMIINPSGGNVGIGTANPGSYRLAVNGGIHSQSVNVDLTGWSDYVFNHGYMLPTLAEVKTFIDQNHHLPDMPSEKDVISDGINLGEMNRLLTKKVEELTLYLIEKDKKDAEQQKEIDELKAQVKMLLQKSK